MIAMPIAGQLSDRIGSGRIVPFGLLAVIASVLWLTQIGARTSYVAISIDLFVFGLGMGFTMMPIFTAAMQSVSGAAAARGQYGAEHPPTDQGVDWYHLGSLTLRKRKPELPQDARTSTAMVL